MKGLCNYYFIYLRVSPSIINIKKLGFFYIFNYSSSLASSNNLINQRKKIFIIKNLNIKLNMKFSLLNPDLLSNSSVLSNSSSPNKNSLKEKEFNSLLHVKSLENIEQRPIYDSCT